MSRPRRRFILGSAALSTALPKHERDPQFCSIRSRYEEPDFPARQNKFPDNFAREFELKQLKLPVNRGCGSSDLRCFSRKFPVFCHLSGNFSRDWFAADCAHHHPVCLFWAVFERLGIAPSFPRVSGHLQATFGGETEVRLGNGAIGRVVSARPFPHPNVFGCDGWCITTMWRDDRPDRANSAATGSGCFGSVELIDAGAHQADRASSRWRCSGEYLQAFGEPDGIGGSHAEHLNLFGPG